MAEAVCSRGFFGLKITEKGTMHSPYNDLFALTNSPLLAGSHLGSTLEQRLELEELYPSLVIV